MDQRAAVGMDRIPKKCVAGNLSRRGVAEGGDEACVVSSGSCARVPSTFVAWLYRPFTGSGILNAMLTGELAGLAAASYLRDCRRLLRRVFLVSSAFRAIIASGQAGLLASLV